MQASRSSVRRACDACKRRKVKCDTEHPCANCRIARLDCTYTVAQRKRGPRTILSASSPSCGSSLNLPISIPGPSRSASVASPESRSPDTPSVAYASPLQDSTPRRSVAEFNTVIDSTPSPSVSQSIQSELLCSLQSAIPVPSNPLLVTNHCIDLFMQYVFPTAPWVHEPTLRGHAQLFFADSCTTTFPTATNRYELITLLRGFTLITALCASVVAMMPDMVNPPGQTLAKHFLHASMETLKSFEINDLEHPSAASMTIRLFHSSALQHITGKSGAAWHLQSQAALIANTLRLHSEHTVAQVNDPIESLLLRHHFWAIYASDQVAAAFQNRAFILDDSLFQENVTLQSIEKPGIALLDSERPQYDEQFVWRLLKGFYLFRSVSCQSAKIVLRMRRHGPSVSETDARILTQEYLGYIALIDSMPEWLQIPNLVDSYTDDETERIYKRSFWVQRCTILTVYHSMRLVILRQCIQSRMFESFGLSDDPHGLALKSIEIFSDVLQALQDIPIIYLRVKGEPTVERIRQIGSILLEVIHTIGDETMKDRAQTYCRRLLDLLAALNSKTSDNFMAET
ncbi:hypothetical protein BU24DRAFT_403110 [Aaosphaeria arxii CBS 175.79]|uniref:Zn(2)-C6 fungal-type domain-containing protein n=1 Tax=Aaosphaeria arxii CBS 175.79 TaxID=1450172 RepID=A0A6A5X6H8_9PLEO|nr:uncharacterized protein BU24DRAFT_403110 [Aaosphaeria arxii CBS 175.79]KAF2008491.1 hypothetical protein BU24DRAFT_403110 [Aaosphaeria arxii CBS 175.79]